MLGDSVLRLCPEISKLHWQLAGIGCRVTPRFDLGTGERAKQCEDSNFSQLPTIATISLSLHVFVESRQTLSDEGHGIPHIPIRKILRQSLGLPLSWRKAVDFLEPLHLCINVRGAASSPHSFVTVAWS